MDNKRKNVKHALCTQIAIQLKFVWLTNTCPTWTVGLRKFVLEEEEEEEETLFVNGMYNYIVWCSLAQ